MAGEPSPAGGGGGMPAAAAASGQQPQGQGGGTQAPFGTSPVTGPTPNQGLEAAALQKAGIISKQLMDILNMTGPHSDLGKAVLKMLDIINKQLPSGSVTPAAERQNLESMAFKNTQDNAQMQALKQQRQQPQGGQPQPGQPAKVASMPSMPGAGP